MTSDLHKAYLSLGSNIEPQVNIPKAVELLKKYGDVVKVSTVWESHAVGVNGPNFLNVCLLLLTNLQADQLKTQILLPVEVELGRTRKEGKSEPRTIDIDMMMFENMLLSLTQWEYAFVVVPLAELLPDFLHPFTLKKLSLMSAQMQDQIWIVPRRDVFIS